MLSLSLFHAYYIDKNAECQYFIAIFFKIYYNTMDFEKGGYAS